MGQLRSTRDHSIARLERLVAVMRREGIQTATLADGTSAAFDAAHPPPKVVTVPVPATGAAPMVTRSCACKHKLSRHTADGQCLEQLPNGAPCTGRCELVTGG